MTDAPAPQPEGTPDSPAGHVWLTVDVHGAQKFTAGIPVGGLASLVAPVDRTVGEAPGAKSDPVRHQAFKDMVGDWLRNPPAEIGGVENFRETAVAFLLWCALNHPRKGAEFAKMLSERIRVSNTASVTAFCDERRVWGFVIADAPVAPASVTAGLEPGFGHHDRVEPGSVPPVPLN